MPRLGVWLRDAPPDSPGSNQEGRMPPLDVWLRDALPECVASVSGDASSGNVAIFTYALPDSVALDGSESFRR